MKVSVITTVWNVEEWLDKNIQAFLNQTLKESELILVNDCSPDNSQSIIDKYKDDRIKCVINETNLGPGVSRQVGLDNSCGEYTIFVDGDDWLEPDCLETMYNEAINQNADIVSCKVYQHNQYGLNKKKSIDEVFVTTDVYNFINNKLIKRDMWDKTHYSPLRFREDINTLFRCLELSNKTIFIDYVGYNYNLRPNSLTSTANVAGKSYIYNALAAIENINFVIEKNIKPSKLFRRIYNTYQVGIHLMIGQQILKEDVNLYSKEIEEIKTFLKQFYEKFNKQNRIR